GGERPEAVEQISPIGAAHRLAARADDGGDALNVASGVDFLLRARVQVADDVIMRVVDAEHPGGRHAALRHGGDRIDMGAHGKLRTAPFLGAEYAEQTAV